MDVPRLVVVGNGMVGQRFLELVGARNSGRWQVVALGEETRPAYDRVALSSLFDGKSPDDLSLVDDRFATLGIPVCLGERVTAIDREARAVHTEARTVPYDRLVLATGSYPFVPPVPGHDRAGTFVYRTVEDLEAIRQWAGRDGVTRGAVVGGGLLGLEAANALCMLGVQTHVVEFADRLMPAQLDHGGAAMLQARIESLGVQVLTGRSTTEIAGIGPAGPVTEMVFADGTSLEVDMVVFSAGIRARDELARNCGLDVGERGGIVVDPLLTTSDPAISAIGECALVDGRIYGLVAPGYEMADRLADLVCLDQARPFHGADMSTKLKLLGVDVASFGEASRPEAADREIVWSDPLERVYRKVVVDSDTGRMRGGILVGDIEAYGMLRAMATGEVPTPEDPGRLVAPGGERPAGSAFPDAALVCSCENVSAGSIRAAVTQGATTAADVGGCTRAGTGCGACLPTVADLVRAELGHQAVPATLCEHFAHSRQELYDLIRFHRHGSFSDVLAAHGSGRGCETCRPVVASILAGLTGAYILDGEQAALQDSNDHFLANLQRNGTYSVVPRVPGGEITPAQLIALGEIARDFGLYTKITGGQRIDLFGATVDQLPEIWRRVIDSGLESGHAYGKAVRTVKSCVGTTWCRYGVQDSTTMAIRLEHRYRGLRAPHKIKMAVSGCARECAEAQSKDVGVIATERGWNLYVAGNGGRTPRHADLFATDLSDEELVTFIDRFLMFYIRTADRLERTSTWFEKLEGGVEHLRSVVVDDVLGIAAELDAGMAQHVDTYECEWNATLSDPERLGRFVTFVNAPGEPDRDIVFVEERGQLRPSDERDVAVAIR